MNHVNKKLFQLALKTISVVSVGIISAVLQQTDAGAFGFAPVSVCHCNSMAWGYVMEEDFNAH